MSRADYLDLIQRDLDGDLSMIEKEMLERKLKIDPELQLIHSRLSHVSVSLEQLPKVAPPFSLVDSILPQLEMEAPTPEPAVTQTKSSVVELPRLEKKSTAAAVEAPKRSIPVWLLKVSSGVVAACLMFGMYTMAHKAILSDEQDNNHGNGTVQEVDVTNVPKQTVEPPKDQTPVVNETQQPPGDDANQTKPPVKPDQSSAVKENPAKSSPTNQYTKVDDNNNSKDKDKEKNNSKIKDPKNGKAVPPNNEKKPASENKKNESNKNNNNGSKSNDSKKTESDDSEQENGNGNGNGKANGLNKDKDKNNNKDKNKGKDKDDDENENEE